MGLIVLSVVGILAIGFCMFVASRPTAQPPAKDQGHTTV